MRAATGELDFAEYDSTITGTMPMEEAQKYNNIYGDCDEVEVGCEFEVDGLQVRLPEGKLSLNHVTVTITGFNDDGAEFRAEIRYMDRAEYEAEFSEDAFEKYQEEEQK